MLLKNIRSLKHAVLLLCHLKPSAQCWCVSLRKNSREFGVFMLFHIYIWHDEVFLIIACLYYNHIIKILTYWNIYQLRQNDSMYCFGLLYDPFDTLWRSFFSYKMSSQGYKNLFIILRMEYVSHYCYHFWNRVW